MNNSHIADRKSKKWELKNISISHNIIDFYDYGSMHASNETDYVRLHFGLAGSYEFSFAQLNSSFVLSGHHNNIMYSKGLELEVQNSSKRIETFGVDFQTAAFIEIGQNGNEVLKRFTDNVIQGKNSILSPKWKTTNLYMQQVIQDIIHCPYSEDLQRLFLHSKSIELLVLQAKLYEEDQAGNFIKSEKDRKKLIEAKEVLSTRLDDPPTIIELSKLMGINEYKLKRGFKELFGTTIFGYIHAQRMELAKKLLLGSSKSAKEIAYETGYSSPQHFSHAFKKTFGVTPNSVRKNPDSAIR
ncbi:MAG: AraC family transcriptional regulator [Bacteroidia bacterium]|nr:AraC family transcriptional regulator [Bacteroidia bacterium]